MLETLLLWVMAFATPLVILALAIGPSVLELLARRVARRPARRD
jgi:hypothetical protein